MAYASASPEKFQDNIEIPSGVTNLSKSTIYRLKSLKTNACILEKFIRSGCSEKRKNSVHNGGYKGVNRPISPTKTPGEYEVFSSRLARCDPPPESISSANCGR